MLSLLLFAYLYRSPSPRIVLKRAHRNQASLEDYRRKAEQVCALSFGDVLYYYETNLFMTEEKLAEMIPDFCFLVSYVYALLTEGYGFNNTHSITVLSTVSG